jgi:hypothetical protein
VLLPLMERSFSKIKKWNDKNSNFNYKIL